MTIESVSQVTPDFTVAARPMRTWSRAGTALATTETDDSGASCNGLAGPSTEVSAAGGVTTDAIRRYFLTQVANMTTFIQLYPARHRESHTHQRNTEKLHECPGSGAVLSLPQALAERPPRPPPLRNLL